MTLEDNSSNQTRLEYYCYSMYVMRFPKGWVLLVRSCFDVCTKSETRSRTEEESVVSTTREHISRVLFLLVIPERR